MTEELNKLAKKLLEVCNKKEDFKEIMKLMYDSLTSAVRIHNIELKGFMNKTDQALIDDKDKVMAEWMKVWNDKNG